MLSWQAGSSVQESTILIQESLSLRSPKTAYRQEARAAFPDVTLSSGQERKGKQIDQKELSETPGNLSECGDQDPGKGELQKPILGGLVEDG